MISFKIIIIGEIALFSLAGIIVFHMGFIQKDVLRTTVLSYAGLALGYINRVFLFLLLLTAEQMGLVNLIISVGILLAQLSNLGSIYVIWKFFPFFRNEAKKHYGFLLMNLMIATVGCLLSIAMVVLFEKQIGSYYLEKSQLFIDYYYLIVPIGVATVYFLLFENYMRGLGKNIMPVFLNEFVLRLLLTALLLLYSVKLINFDFFLISYALIHFVPTLVLTLYLIKKKELTFSLKSISIPHRFKKIIISFSLYSYLNSIGIIIIFTLDAMMIAAMVGLGATGIYTFILNVISAVQIPYKSLVRVSSPLVTVYWKEKKMEEMNALYKKVSSISLIVSLMIFGLIWINRESLFSLLPDEFRSGIYTFLFLMSSRVIDMYFGLNGIIFGTSKKFRYDVIFTIVLLAMVVGMNLWLIPVYGMTGAAISTAVALLVYNVGRVIFIYVAYDLHPFETNQFKIWAVFLALIYFFEMIFPEFDNFYLSVGLNSVIFSLCFCLPIFLLRWNEDLNNYARAGYKFVRDNMDSRKKKNISE